MGFAGGAVVLGIPEDFCAAVFHVVRFLVLRSSFFVLRQAVASAWSMAALMA